MEAIDTALMPGATEFASLNFVTGCTKSDLTALAKKSVEQIAQNGQDLLSLIAYTKKLNHFAEQIEAAAKARAINELALYGKGGVEKLGVQLVVAEVGVKYDYSNDPVWNRLNFQLQDAASKLKSWENALKPIPSSGLMLVDEENGELYRAYPPAKTATESIRATISNSRP